MAGNFFTTWVTIRFSRTLLWRVGQSGLLLVIQSLHILTEIYDDSWQSVLHLLWFFKILHTQDLML